MKVCLVGSSGGHLTHLYMLKPFWNEYAYRLKKNVNIVQLTFNSSFAKSLVSMYAFPAKVLKKLSVNSFIAYYDFISNCVTNVFEKTYDIAIDFYGYEKI